MAGWSRDWQPADMLVEQRVFGNLAHVTGDELVFAGVYRS